MSPPRRPQTPRRVALVPVQMSLGKIRADYPADFPSPSACAMIIQDSQFPLSHILWEKSTETGREVTLLAEAAVDIRRLSTVELGINPLVSAPCLGEGVFVNWLTVQRFLLLQTGLLVCLLICVHDSLSTYILHRLYAVDEIPLASIQQAKLQVSQSNVFT